MGDKHADDNQVDSGKRAVELGDDELEQASGGRGEGSGCKVCSNCGTRYNLSSRRCPLCKSGAYTTLRFR